MAAAAVVQAGSPAQQTFGIGWSQSTLTAVRWECSDCASAASMQSRSSDSADRTCSGALTDCCRMRLNFSDARWLLMQMLAQCIISGSPATRSVSPRATLCLAADCIRCVLTQSSHLLLSCRCGHFHLVQLRRWRAQSAERCFHSCVRPRVRVFFPKPTSPLPLVGGDDDERRSISVRGKQRRLTRCAFVIPQFFRESPIRKKSISVTGRTDNAGGSCGFDGIMRGTENMPIFVGDFQLPSDAITLPLAHRQRAAGAAEPHHRRIDTRRQHRDSSSLIH